MARGRGRSRSRRKREAKAAGTFRQNVEQIKLLRLCGAGPKREPARLTIVRAIFDVIKSLTCPICKKELPPGAALESKWFPFCGERCRNVDLYRWTSGRYAIVEPLKPDADLPDTDWEGHLDEGPADDASPLS